MLSLRFSRAATAGLRRASPQVKNIRGLATFKTPKVANEPNVSCRDTWSLELKLIVIAPLRQGQCAACWLDPGS